MRNIDSRINRAAKKYAKGTIILKRFQEYEPEGGSGSLALNAVRKVIYDPVKIEHCDIKHIPFEKQETHAGVEVSGDTIACVFKIFYEGTIGGKDMVNIGGYIKEGAVMDGIDYRIVDIKDVGVLYRLTLERVKL